MKVKTILFIFLFLILTLITQVGGIILLLCIPFFRRINKKYPTYFLNSALKSLIFLSVYLFLSFSLIPALASLSGRKPLPAISNQHLKPLNTFTWLLNRHYVKPELLEITERVAKKMNTNSPGTITTYLDANFPFINNFPLLPHWSHNDGKKLDLAFFYKDNSNNPLNRIAPSFMGYGVFEEPLPEERNTPSECAQKGFFQYSFLGYLVPQSKKSEMPFDSQRTKTLINFLLAEERVGKLFIEPHLKKRLDLHNEKVRFHGCHAVRHDDHIHFQLK